MKRIFTIFLTLSFILSFAPHVSRAALTEDLQQKIQNAQAERDNLLEEQRKLQAQLDALNSQHKTLSGAVQSLDATKKKLANDIKLTESKVKNADLNIEALESSMTQKEAEIVLHKKAIASTIQNLSEYDSRSMITDLLTYDKISDVWEDQGNLQSLEDSLSLEISKLKDAQVVLNMEKDLKEQNKNDLISLKQQLGGQKAVVENTQASKAKLLAETKNQEAAYQKLLAENIAREKEFEKALFDYESQLKVALDPGGIPTVAHSILSWPLAKITVTQQFGKTSSSGRLYASGTHNGIDLGTPVGTAVMAVRQGTIKAQGNTDLQPGCGSYGRWILVEHDNGLSTIYGHLSATIVGNGQAVKTGQIIGYSGGQPGADGAGYSTGPHLHLGLYATQAVRVMQYTTSIGCKNVSIPIAPPDGYLDPLAYLPKL